MSVLLYYFLYVQLRGEEEDEVILGVGVVISGGRGGEAVDHSTTPFHSAPNKKSVYAGAHFGDAFVGDIGFYAVTQFSPSGVA
jgi:hypothetical protein